jgi:hypothetical protein
VILSAYCINQAIARTNAGMQARKKLTVADFKGQPDETVDYLAQTTPVISLKYAVSAGCPGSEKIKLKVETGIAVSPRSWIKASKIRNPDLLNSLLSHEQGHYDMGEIFSIELKRTLSGICYDKNNYKQQVDSVFKSMYARYDSLQKSYDVDTDHMRNRQSQSRWKEKIAGMWKNIE